MIPSSPSVRTILTLLVISLFPLHHFAQNVLDFDGIDDQVVIPNASSTIANSDLSLAFWVYPTNPNPGWPDFDGIAGFRNDINADFYILQLSATNVEARFRNSSGTNFDIVYNGIVLNTWNHFVLTYDGTNMVLYHNGTIAGTQTASGNITSTTSPLNIGFLPFSSNNFYLDGRMDDVALYNKALNQSEVTTLYNDCTVDLTHPNLQVCYQFNQGVAGGTNTGITSITDSKGNINGSLTGFTLNGTVSNFVTGGKNTAGALNPVVSCSYTSPSGLYTWDSTGVYMDTISNVAGCDSFLTIDLIVNSTDTILNPVVCSSYTSPSGLYVWDSTGTYQDTIPASGGCDSTFTINLTVNNSFSSRVDSACQSYTSPSGHIWTMSGTYVDTIPNMAGCDSLISIDLTVNSLDTSVTQNGNTLTSNATGVSYQWVNCDNNFAAIPGATNSSYTVTFNGNYAVIISDSACSDTSACIFLTPTSIQSSLFSNAVQAVPNPHQDALRLDLPMEYDQIELKISDLAGKQIFQGSYANLRSIPLKIDAAPGIYIVRIKADGKNGIVKIVRQSQK